MAHRCKILLASHSPTCTTGYGRVTRRLAHAIGKAGHTVAVAGLSYRGGPHELPYRIFPWQDRRPGESFAGICREFGPDVLLTIYEEHSGDIVVIPKHLRPVIGIAIVRNLTEHGHRPLGPV